jgi:competence protein ComEA
MPSSPRDLSKQSKERRTRAIAIFPWSTGARGLLGGLGILVALALRMAIHSAEPGDGTSYPLAPVLVVDPNTAPAGVLEALPHIGPSLVRKLVEQRQIRPFDSISDMRRRVRGLGPSTMALLSPYLRIELSGREIRVDRVETVVAVPEPQRLAEKPKGQQTQSNTRNRVTTSPHSGHPRAL